MIDSGICLQLLVKQKRDPTWPDIDQRLQLPATRFPVHEHQPQGVPLRSFHCFTADNEEAKQLLAAWSIVT